MSNIETVTPRRLSRAGAAQYLRENWGMRTSAASLAKRAWAGNGPAYRKGPRNVVYDVEALDAWAASRLSGPVTSTSEYSTRAA